MLKRKLKKGFTLLELAIVLLVLSFLVVGVLVGKQLVIKAKIASIVFELRQVESRYEEFIGTYGFVPGDATEKECNLAPEFSSLKGGFICYNGGTTLVTYNGADLGSSAATYRIGGTTSYSTSYTAPYFIYSDGSASSSAGKKGNGTVDTPFESVYAHWMFSAFNGSNKRGEAIPQSVAADGSAIAINYAWIGNTYSTSLNYYRYSNVMYDKLTVGKYYWFFAGLGSDWLSACNRSGVTCANSIYNNTRSGAIGVGDQADAVGYNFIVVMGKYASNSYDFSPFTIEESKLLKAKMDGGNSEYPLKGEVVFSPIYSAQGHYGLQDGNYSSHYFGYSSATERATGNYDLCARNYSDASYSYVYGQNLVWSRSGDKGNKNNRRPECAMFIRLKRL